MASPADRHHRINGSGLGPADPNAEEGSGHIETPHEGLTLVALASSEQQHRTVTLAAFAIVRTPRPPANASSLVLARVLPKNRRMHRSARLLCQKN
jgi:hypothetical protein